MSNTPLAVYKYRGYVIHIWPDEIPHNPRDWGNFGHMICSHRRYQLGDEQIDSSQFNSWQEVREHISNERDAAVILPLYLMDHSGLYLSTSGFGHADPGRWDWGQVGFIYATREAILKEYGTLEPENIDKAKRLLEGEVSTYAKYLAGAVYGFTIEDPMGYVVESAWGFYDVGDRLLRECYDIIDRDISEHGLAKRCFQKALEALDAFAYYITEGNFSPRSSYVEVARREESEEEEEECTF